MDSKKNFNKEVFMSLCIAISMVNNRKSSLYHSNAIAALHLTIRSPTSWKAADLPMQTSQQDPVDRWITRNVDHLIEQVRSAMPTLKWLQRHNQETWLLTYPGMTKCSW